MFTQTEDQQEKGGTGGLGRGECPKGKLPKTRGAHAMRTTRGNTANNVVILHTLHVHIKLLKQYTTVYFYICNANGIILNFF